MATRYIPDHLRHSPTPRIEGFAMLSGLEAGVRGMLISVMPLVMYAAYKDAALVSRIYFIVGIVSLIVGLMVPFLTRYMPRRWMYTCGTLLYLIGMALAVSGGQTATALALGCNAVATVTIFVCLNAYVLDYIPRIDLGRSQSLQMMYSAASWSIGPVLGVWLHTLWAPAPFLLAAAFALALLVTFWVLRLGNGKEISRAKGPPPNPVAFLGRFARQPRLIAGWLFAVIRSCGWWVYVVYLPIYCIEAGLGDKIAGVCLSITNALLFTSPLLLRLVKRATVRRAVQGGFLFCGVFFCAATTAAGVPLLAVALMMAGSVFLVLLDVSAGLPFLMAVKPSERTEMSAVYSSFRDVSGILTPGAAYLVLLVLPVSAIFAASGAGLLAAWGVAQRLHPRLGVPRRADGFSPAPGE